VKRKKPEKTKSRNPKQPQSAIFWVDSGCFAATATINQNAAHHRKAMDDRPKNLQ